MDTLNLRLFVLASELLNISAAGRQLGLAPAAASARLAKLEHEFGADLLHRSTRKVALSMEGEEFLPFAREILAQEEAAKAAMGQGSVAPHGTLRFTAPSSFAQLYIAPILPEFTSAFPDVALDLKFSDTTVDLIEGSFDLALRNNAAEDSSFKARKLADDTRVLCAAPEYLEQHGTPQHPDDLTDHQLIAFKNRGPRRLVGADGLEGTFAPRMAKCQLLFDDGTSQKAATIAGGGISGNSLWSVHRELREGSLVRVLPDYQIDDGAKLWLVYPKANVLSLKVRAFLDFLLMKIGKSPPWLR